MVYKIRHRGFWETRPGNGHYDRNFHSFIKFLDPPKEQTLFISRKNESYFPFRYLHVYRTLKRAGNQFFQGNKLLENAWSLTLRSMYQRVPAEMWTDRIGGPDMLVHKGERHWELMTYNQHPLQHDFYELFNKYCHLEMGQKTEEEQEAAKALLHKFEDIIKQKREKLGLEAHETLEVSDLQDAFDEVMKIERANASSHHYVRPAEEKEADEAVENPRRVSFFY